MKKQLSKYMGALPRQVVVYALVVVLVSGLLWWRLGSLVPGLSDPELAARGAASSGKALLHNPLFLPHKLLQYVFIKLGHQGAFWMRLPSTLFTVLMLVAFYRIVRTWYSVRIAALCSLLFVSSAWLLHYARLGTPEIMYTGSIGILWAGIRLKSNRPRTTTVLLGTIVVLGNLYVPSMVWLLVPLLVWQRRTIWDDVRYLPKLMFPVLVFGSLAALAPLVYGFVRDPVLLRTWAGVPADFTVSSVITNATHLPVWLTVRGPEDAVRWLGRVPLLDVFSVVMFTLGIYVYHRFVLLDRVRTIVLMLAIGAALTILNGPWMLILIAPILYVVVASGIALMLQQWFTVFPNNPLARWVGLGMVITIVAMASGYNLTHYFIAWPKAAPTRQVFRTRG